MGSIQARKRMFLAHSKIAVVATATTAEKEAKEMVDFRALGLINQATRNLKAILKASKEVTKKGIDTEIQERLINNEIQAFVDNIVEAAKRKTLESIRINGLPAITNEEANVTQTLGDEIVINVPAWISIKVNAQGINEAIQLAQNLVEKSAKEGKSTEVPTKISGYNWELARVE